MIANIKDCTFDNKYYWSIVINPNATVENCLPNCTTLCYGAVLQDKHLPPVSKIRNANQWHNMLTNGWSFISYDREKLEIGDIVEWTTNNHVAIVSQIVGDKINVSASWFTDENGKSTGQRNSFQTLEQVSNFMLTNYPYRYFHLCTIEEEIKGVGIPEYILKHPLYSVGRDKSVDQIEVTTFEQNVRDENNNILKKAEKGFYNIISTNEHDGYTWYEVEPNKFIAGVNGRVFYYPSEIDLQTEVELLRKENQELKDLINQIHNMTEV